MAHAVVALLVVGEQELGAGDRVLSLLSRYEQLGELTEIAV